MIPAGAVIERLYVAKNTAEDLPVDLELVLGLVPADESDAFGQSSQANLAEYASIITSYDQPLTGAILNRHSVVAYDLRQSKSRMAAINAVLDSDLTSHSVSPIPPDYTTITNLPEGAVWVGARRSLLMAVTVKNGTVAVKDLKFVVIYKAPIVSPSSVL